MATKSASPKKKAAAKKKSAPRKQIRKSAAKKAAAKKVPAKKSAAKKTSTASKSAKKSAPKKAVKKWSGKVTETSDAMDLKAHIFESNDPAAIAKSIKHSSEKSNRKKGSTYQSAMSMLNFYENRAGKNLTASHKATLEKAKDELRKLFGREEA